MSTTAFNTSMLHAVSPLPSAIAHASSTDEESACITHDTMYQGATSVDDLVAMVPQDFHHVLRTPLPGVARWKAHQMAGTFPPTFV